MEIPNLCRDQIYSTEPNPNPYPNLTLIESGLVRVRFGFGTETDSDSVEFGRDTNLEFTQYK